MCYLRIIPFFGRSFFSFYYCHFSPIINIAGYGVLSDSMLEKRCLTSGEPLRVKGAGVKLWAKVIFWLIPALLAASLALTIIGGATNHGGLLNAGIVGWLASSALFFVWLVLWIWTRRKRYEG